MSRFLAQNNQPVAVTGAFKYVDIVKIDINQIQGNQNICSVIYQSIEAFKDKTRDKVISQIFSSDMSKRYHFTQKKSVEKILLCDNTK